MKYSMPEISWHGRDPVYSVDFQYKQNEFRVATAGIDKTIRIWRLVRKDGKIALDFLSTLKKHEAAVNVVRFDPDGERLASGDVEAVIFLWHRSSSNAPDIFGDDNDEGNKENWVMLSTFRGHLKDICDLCWSPNGTHLASVSVDKSLIVWNTRKKDHSPKRMGKHRQFPNGVCWDPRGTLLVSLGTDRDMLIYEFKNENLKLLKKITKATLLPCSKVRNSLQSCNSEQQKLFWDDSLMSFVRRPCFSPDGELLMAPAGCVELDGKTINATFIFTRSNLNSPSVILPCPAKASIEVRCCPVLFELFPDSENLVNLPYRLVFAVLCQDAVLLYHTQQRQPFGYLGKIHYCGLTDLSWAENGQLLLISSVDGYCSVITFEEGELGIPLVEIPPLPPSPVKTPKCARTPKVDRYSGECSRKEQQGNSDKTSGSKSRKRSVERNGMTIEKIFRKMTTDTKKDEELAKLESEKTENCTTCAESAPDSNSKRSETVNSTPTSSGSGYSPPMKVPRRVQFVTLPRPLHVENKPEFCPPIRPRKNSMDVQSDSVGQNDSQTAGRNSTIPTTEAPKNKKLPRRVQFTTLCGKE